MRQYYTNISRQRYQPRRRLDRRASTVACSEAAQLIAIDCAATSCWSCRTCGTPITLQSPIKFWETLFQSLYSGSPFRRGRLAYRILIAEHADLLDRLRDRDGHKPLYGNEVFRAIRIVGKLAVVFGVRQLQERFLAR